MVKSWILLFRRLNAYYQCDQIGRFLKVFSDTFFTKVTQTNTDFLGYFEKHPFKIKTAMTTFWATYGKIWALFYFKIWSHW